MLCTTSPSSRRSDAPNQGEWSFIAPVTSPFPNFEDDAFHCLVQAQHKLYLNIFDGVISPQGNVIALLSKGGKICLIPLMLSPENGMSTDLKANPIEITQTLAYNDTIGKASIRFSPKGRYLFGIDHKSNILVVDLDRRGSAVV